MSLQFLHTIYFLPMCMLTVLFENKDLLVLNIAIFQTRPQQEGSLNVPC